MIGKFSSFLSLETEGWLQVPRDSPWDLLPGAPGQTGNQETLPAGVCWGGGGRRRGDSAPGANPASAGPRDRRHCPELSGLQTPRRPPLTPLGTGDARGAGEADPRVWGLSERKEGAGRNAASPRGLLGKQPETAGGAEPGSSSPSSRESSRANF